MLKALMISGLALSASVALAEPQTTADTDASKPTQAAKPKADRVICETEQQIGSRLPGRQICMTATQWKEHEQQVHQQLDQTHVNVEASGGSPG